MKALLTSTGLALILAMTPAMAQQYPADPPAAAEPAEPAAPDVTAPAEPALPDVAAEEEFYGQLEEGQWLASNMMGHEVFGPNDESIGTISDFIFDEEGNVVAVVIGVGEYLGIGVKDVAVSYEHVDVTHEADDLRITTDLSRDQLEDAPEFDRLAELEPGLDLPTPDPAMPAEPATPDEPATPGEPGLPQQ